VPLLCRENKEQRGRERELCNSRGWMDGWTDRSDKLHLGQTDRYTDPAPPAPQDPLAAVADGIAAETSVLALDEFFVTDVADAAILSRLFGRLWDDGLVLVSTSNRHPDALYEGGLQRNLFLPFIDRLKVRRGGHDLGWHHRA
jgi:predicted ATPase